LRQRGLEVFDDFSRDDVGVGGWRGLRAIHLNGLSTVTANKVLSRTAIAARSCCFRTTLPVSTRPWSSATRKRRCKSSWANLRRR